MSGFLALAGLTSAMQHVLAPAAATVPGAVVTTLRPDRLDQNNLKRGINLFLYSVAPNPDLRGEDLPTRRADGSFRAVPTLALDVHYLLSAYGDDAALEPQRLLGAALARVHAFPVLHPHLVRAALDAADPAIGASTLDQQRPPVMMELEGLDPEALVRMWQVFYQVPYQLSVALRCVAVRVPADVETTEIPPPKRVGLDPRRLGGGS